MQDYQKRILLLASYPKSGNTWFRIFLSNLLSDTDTPKSINKIQDSNLASSRLLFDDILGTSSSDLYHSEIDELRSRVYERISAESDKTIFIKVHDAWRKTESGLSIFPNSVTKGVLYFIRNPLDVAVSFSYHSSKPISTIISQMNNQSFTFCENPGKLFHQLKQEIFNWSEHVTSWIDNSGLPTKVIRYEDMLHDTYNTFNSALDFIGVKKESSEILEAISKSSFDTLSKIEKNEGFKEKPLSMDKFFREGKAGNWKSHLNAEMIKNITQNHGDIMIRFGYYEKLF